MIPPHWQHKALGTDITLRTNQGQVSRQLLMVLFPYREGLPRPPPLLAQANLPFGYPVHGVEVMPLHTIPIPGRYRSTQKTETTFASAQVCDPSQKQAAPIPPITALCPAPSCPNQGPACI